MHICSSPSIPVSRFPCLVFHHQTRETHASAKTRDPKNQDDDGSPTQLNEQITNRLWSELISPLLEPCRSAAETLLCHYAFPSCSFSVGQPSTKPLCREDCIAVRDLFCYNEWAMVEENGRKGIHFKNRGHFRLPDCESLPSHSNLTDPPCTHAGLTSIRLDEVTYTCIKGRGRYYQGPVNVTRTGLPCQRWDSQEPHSHNRPPFVFPEIWNSENYCRNAGGEEPVPWCYTRDPRTRWQHCDIPVCGKSSSRSLFPHLLPVVIPFFGPRFCGCRSCLSFSYALRDARIVRTISSRVMDAGPLFPAFWSFFSLVPDSQHRKKRVFCPSDVDESGILFTRRESMTQVSVCKRREKKGIEVGVDMDSESEMRRR